MESIISRPEVITLENGLQVILEADHSAPVISAQAWVMTGSVHEGSLLGTGVSHALEHMLFKGTEKRPASRIDHEIQAAGGAMNAYTSFDHTVYWINAPDTGIGVACDVLCDMLIHATIPDAEWDKERDVILREMDMNQDDPSRRSARRFFETVYLRSHYRYPIIGYPDLFQSLTAESIRDYYHERYAPNNAFLVFVGDFDVDQLKEQIHGIFDSVPRRSVSPVLLPQEYPQVDPRIIHETGPFQQTRSHIGWKTPGALSEDMPALSLFSMIVGSGHSSRLNRAVRERTGLVNQISAWLYPEQESCLFGISAEMDPSNQQQALDCIEKEMARALSHPCSEEEFRKVIRQFEVSELQSRETMQGRAQDLASNWALAGDLDFSERCLEKAKSLTPEKILSVAQQWLVPNGRTLYTLAPEQTSEEKPRVRSILKRESIKKRTLPNGWTALFLPERRLPFVNIQSVFLGGLLSESASNNGISSLLARTWMKGDKHRTGEEIAESLESMGASLSPYAGSNSVGLGLEILESDLQPGLDLYWDTLLNPTFPESEVARERQIQLNQIQSRKDQILQMGMDAFRVSMFGSHPYSMNRVGTDASVSSIQPSDLRNYHRDHVLSQPATLAVFGSVDPDRAMEWLDRKTQNLQKVSNELIPADPPAPNFPTTAQRVHVPWDKSQAACILGFPGATIHSEDRWALGLLDAACSDMGSRIFLKIRDELGLAYYCGATNLLGRSPGYFAFYVGCAKESLARVEEELWGEITKLTASPLAVDELDRIKAKIIGQMKISRQSLDDEALSASLDELYGLGFANRERDIERYQSVTSKEIQEIAAKYFKRDTSVVATISA